MTASILEQHAIGRRQYHLLLQRDLRKMRSDMRQYFRAEMIRRGLDCVLFFSTVAVFSYAFFGWMGV